MLCFGFVCYIVHIIIVCKHQQPKGLTLSGSSGNYDIARRYATAFFELATQQGGIDAITEDMKKLAMLGKDAGDFADFLNNAALGRAEQTKAILAIAKHLKLSSVTEKLLGTLAEKRRLPVFNAVVAQVQKLIAEQKGEITATVTAAQALDQSQIAEIEANLKKITGKNVRVDLEIDADIVGGLVIRVGSKLIDSSVRTKLDRLHRALKNSTNTADKNKMKEVA